MKENKGITLVALVITIIVLIILAGITISMVLGENGLIGKAKQGAEEYKNAAADELTMLGKINDLIEEYGSLDNTEPTKTGPSVKLKDGTTATITAENISTYIGTEIDYTPTAGGTWRIFYLDTENKYGDGINTLFIKRDYDSSTTFNDSTQSSYTNENAATYLAKFNPKWENSDNNINSRNERISSYLCNSENWNDDYKSITGDNKARYAIGGPSVEMYMDAYNQWGGYTETTGPQSYDFVNAELQGYIVGVNGTYSNSGSSEEDNSISSGTNNIFMTPGSIADYKCWWVASPIYGYMNYGVCRINGYRKNIESWDSATLAICPVVSLQ